MRVKYVPPPILNEEEQAERYRQFSRHVCKSDDLILLTLKGHLLIEELLIEIISNHMKDPAGLWKDFKSEFLDKLCLVRGLCGSSIYWNCIQELNEIRNKYAHNIETPQIEDRIDRFIELALVKPFGKITKSNPAIPEFKTNKARAKYFKRALVTVYQITSAYSGQVQLHHKK